MTVTERTRKTVLTRDNNLCVINGPGCTTTATCADHRANRGSGGSKVLNDPTCLIAACRLCNGLKEDADGPYRARLLARGIRVRKAATNEKTAARCAIIPVLYMDGWHQLEGTTRTPMLEATALEIIATFNGPDTGMVAQMRTGNRDLICSFSDRSNTHSAKMETAIKKARNAQTSEPSAHSTTAKSQEQTP